MTRGCAPRAIATSVGWRTWRIRSISSSPIPPARHCSATRTTCRRRAPNMDNNYARAMLEPTGTYRVSGDISGIKELLISVHEGEMALGKPAVLGEVALGDLEVGEDGWLDLIVGGTQGPAIGLLWNQIRRISIFASS